MPSPSDSEPPLLSLRLLGGFEATHPRLPVAACHIGYEKGRALLAYLAVEQQEPHSRQKLAEIFWPELPLEAARNNLRLVLMDLRQKLEGKAEEDQGARPASVFAADRQTVRFSMDADVCVDVARFTSEVSPVCATQAALEYCATRCKLYISRVEQMVNLYQGELLAGFTLPECPEFEGWLQLKRASLHQRALSLLEQLAQLHDSQARYAQALPFALRLVNLEPLNEVGQRSAMRLLVLNGRKAAALAQFEACGRLLEQELGVAPDRETQQLAELIRIDAIQPADPAPVTQPPAHADANSACKRQITALYCELVPVELDDPARAMTLLRMQQAQCVKTLERYLGNLAQTHEGSLLAYFGYPQACEKSSLLAIEAALLLAQSPLPGMEVRIGIHTGPMTESATAATPDALGLVASAAMRLCLSLVGCEVAMSASTHALIGHQFHCEPLGAMPVRGQPQALETWRVLGVKRKASA